MTAPSSMIITLETPVAELREQIEVGFEQATRSELLDGEEVFRELERVITAHRLSHRTDVAISN